MNSKKMYAATTLIEPQSNQNNHDVNNTVDTGHVIKTPKNNQMSSLATTSDKMIHWRPQNLRIIHFA